MFDFNLILRAADVEPLRLKARFGARLGYDSVLVTKSANIDCARLFALKV